MISGRSKPPCPGGPVTQQEHASARLWLRSRRQTDAPIARRIMSDGRRQRTGRELIALSGVGVGTRGWH